ncbi:glycerophosphodiester phosphodiesterase [Streptomyces sp. A7024]|uniref:glycerophosphodiester phosphodiesterase n=1 Tax=Streptomyces coryli TaxID=1128680 RepID=A0A6G4U0B0_9ACTN|nr:glycerophosphodiester phosphodiesterase [Streptomyces coryli]NGN65584.1 glycerophosphodiester phosphodiesterase [Streptomyces coryli]
MTSLGRRAVLGAAALGAAGAALGASAGTASAAGASGGSRLPVPAVVGHRGASGYRPEHTIGAYELALAMGADIVEQDLVITKDGHLVCRHEPEIGGTTDVANHPEFADRKKTKKLDGKDTVGWWAEDFTLAELKTLRAIERIPANRQENTIYNGRWEVPTFEEVLKWADKKERETGRKVWLHIETKHPTFFIEQGLPLEPPLARLLKKYGRDGRRAPNFVQSFEPTSIQRMKKLVSCPGVVLLSTASSRPYDFVVAGDPRTVADLIKPEGLKWIAGFAQGIGPTLDLVIPKDATGKLLQPTTLVKDAHAAGLVLHPYTMRNENTFLPLDFKRGDDPNAYGDAFGAFKTYYATGIDGIFSDNPDTAKLAAEDFRASQG